jgi:formylmethanofuran dehydrogenase subunit C
MSDGLVLSLRDASAAALDLGVLLREPWVGLDAAALARRPVDVAGTGPVPAGELFEIRGTPTGRLRLEGDLRGARGVGAGLAEGTVVVESGVGDDAGQGMAGGMLRIRGDAGARAGGAAPGHKRGMTGGELVVDGAAGPEAGAGMRRGLLVVGGDAGERAGLGMLAGTVIVFGAAGAGAGQWSKRGSIVAMGGVTPPATYRYACVYRPEYLRLTLMHLRSMHGVPVTDRHVDGTYRRYSGDLAELGKGEILAWTNS